MCVRAFLCGPYADPPPPGKHGYSAISCKGLGHSRIGVWRVGRLQTLERSRYNYCTVDNPDQCFKHIHQLNHYLIHRLHTLRGASATCVSRRIPRLAHVQNVNINVNTSTCTTAEDHNALSTGSSESCITNSLTNVSNL